MVGVGDGGHSPDRNLLKKMRYLNMVLKEGTVRCVAPAFASVNRGRQLTTVNSASTLSPCAD